MREKLTVLCPVYNKEKFLKICIDSILMQKTDFAFKIVFIDDCSTDNSVKIIKEYMNLYPDKIQLLQNKVNKKLFATIFRGYKLLKTKYWTVLDPDDYWIEDSFLQDAVNFLEANPNYMSFVGNTYLLKRGIKSITISQPSRDFSIKNRNGFIYGHTSATVFRYCFSDKDLKKLENLLKVPEGPSCFRGDTFRNLYSASHGDGHFEAKVYSVYNYNEQGIWSELSVEQQAISSIRAFLAYVRFFEKKNVNFFLRVAYYYISQLFSYGFYSSEFEQLFKTWLEYAKESGFLSSINFLKSFCFFYPSLKIGGYQNLFISLAKSLAELGFDVTYVDYPKDTFARKVLKKSKVKFIDYYDNMTFIDDDRAFNIIVPITRAYYHLPEFKNHDSKLFFFVAHHKSFEWVQSLSNLNLQSMYLLFNSLNEKKALCYMDENSLLGTQNYLPFKLQPRYVPIPLAVSVKKSFNKNIINDSEINIAWLGRLDQDKINSINNILDLYHQYKTPKKKKYHIIGQGDAQNLIKSSLYPDIEVIFTGPLIENTRDNYLQKNVDILIGEGTAMLNAAALRIPVLNGINSLTPFSLNKFVWLFDLKDYLLGCHIEQFHHFKNKTVSFKQALNAVYAKGGKERLGQLSFEHLLNFHELQKSTFIFLAFIFNGGFNFKDYLNRNFIKYVLPKQWRLKPEEKLNLLTKYQYKIWKHFDKKIKNPIHFKHKNPFAYKIWKHCGKNLRKQGVI